MAHEPEAEVGTREDIEGLNIQVLAGRNAVLSGVRSQNRVLLNIQTPEAPAAALVPQRPPLQVAVVLDRSGSMGGQKLTFAKRGCTKLVKHFEMRDALHFVSYSNDARVVFQDGDLSDAGKAALRAQIEEVRAGGGTNLFAGLESAVSLLNAEASNSKVDNDNGALRRIFLFSDGIVNQGVTDQATILESVRSWASAGIETSTFGIGADFDESLMRGIAEAGKGRYAYLATAEDIPKLVSKSVHDLLDLYASEVMLDIRGLSYSTVSRIYGAGMDEVGDTDDDSVVNPTGAVPGVLNLGDLHYDNQRRVLFELDVAPPGGTEASFDAAEWTLTMQRNGTSAQYTGLLQLSSTRDRSAIGKEAIPVASAFAIQRSADLDIQVAKHLSRGNREKAREAKEQQITLLKTSLKAVQDASATQDAEVLERVLERAQRVADQLQDLGDDGDSDVVRRHCVHEVDLCRAMSVAGWRSGCDSDSVHSEDCDIANLDDVNFTPPNSPPGSPRPQYSWHAHAQPSSRSPSSSPSPRSRSPSQTRSPSPQLRRASRSRGIRSFFRNAMLSICTRSSGRTNTR